eukprot:2565553-Rhodomonas_salina.1
MTLCSTCAQQSASHTRERPTNGRVNEIVLLRERKPWHEKQLDVPLKRGWGEEREKESEGERESHMERRAARGRVFFWHADPRPLPSQFL